MAQEQHSERIAKRIARAGLASRRDAERMIEAGRVTLNGKRLDTPAITVTDRDRITVDGKPVAEGTARYVMPSAGVARRMLGMELPDAWKRLARKR